MAVMEPKQITALENFEATHVEQGTYQLMRGEYVYGGTAIMARTENGEPAFVLSVYLEGRPLGLGLFWAKTWGENDGILEEMVRRGIVREVGIVSSTGFVEAMMCELTEEYR